MGRRRKKGREYTHAATSSVRYRAWARARGRGSVRSGHVLVSHRRKGPGWQRRNGLGLLFGSAGPTVGPGTKSWICGPGRPGFAPSTHRAAVRRRQLRRLESEGSTAREWRGAAAWGARVLLSSGGCKLAVWRKTGGGVASRLCELAVRLAAQLAASVDFIVQAPLLCAPVECEFSV